MPKKQTDDLLPPIELEYSINAMPAQLFRALTSQNELRKWWAPHVAMSRNKVAQKKGQNIYMKLVSSKEKEESLVRYLWRPNHWPAEAPATSITIRINNPGNSRQNTGEGVFMELIHEGWISEKERSEQERIWRLAIESLQSLLENKKALPWWEKEEEAPSWYQIKPQELKQMIDKLKKNDEKDGKNKAFQNLWQICNALNAEGLWYWSEEELSFNFKCQNQNILRINEEKITLFWRKMDFLPHSHLQSLKERLSVEQDFIFPLEEEETSLPLETLEGALCLSWCSDLFQSIKQEMKKA